MRRELDKEAIDDIRVGAGLLGSGGGGAVWGKTMDNLIKEITRDDRKVTVVSPDELEPHQSGAVVAIMGAPKAMAEKGINAEAVKRAWEALERNLHKDNRFQAVKSFDYAVPVEIGSLNSLAPILIGAMTGIPVLDGDGAGRAVPSLQVLTYAANPLLLDLKPYPLVLGSDNVEESDVRLLVTQVPTAAYVDDVLRGVLGGKIFGEVGALVLWAQKATTSQQSDVVIPNGLQDSQTLGKALKAGQSGTEEQIVDNCMKALTDIKRKPVGRALFVGTLEEPQEETIRGFDFITVTLTNKDDRSTATILGQNENLIAWTSTRSQPLVISPDSTCYLALDGPRKGMSLSNADLHDVVGSKLALIGIQAVSQMRSKVIIERFLQLMRPMGYGGEYVPIEELNAVK